VQDGFEDGIDCSARVDARGITSTVQDGFEDGVECGARESTRA